MSTHETTTKKRRTGGFLKMGIAALAILGIGGAITTAAWVGNVAFTAPASAEMWGLQGRVGTSGSWQEGEIIIDAGEFAGLAPSPTPRTLQVQVHNSGSVDATVTSAITTSGFVGWPNLDQAITLTGDSDEPLVGGGTRTITISVNTANMPSTASGNNGSLIVTFTGTQVVQAD